MGLGLYSKEATALLVVLFSGLVVVVAGLSVLSVSLTSSLAILVLLHLFWIRPRFRRGEGSRGKFKKGNSLIGLLPGHYLLFLAFALREEVVFFVLVLFPLLVIATLLFDLLATRAGAWPRLTSFSSYCIIWGIVFFFLQRLIVNGLQLTGTGSLLTKAGIAVLGGVYGGLGLYRLYRDGDTGSPVEEGGEEIGV